jgi:hypothetical protein
MNVSLNPSAALIDRLLPFGRAGADLLIDAFDGLRQTTRHDTDNKVACTNTTPN